MLFEFEGKRPSVGRDSYVSETAIVLGDVFIGDRCYIGHGAILRGDYGRILIEDDVVIEEAVIVHAPPGEVCHIKRGTIVGHGAIVHASLLEEEVLVGMGAVLSLRSEVGRGSLIGEGTVVRQRERLGAGGVFIGSPPRRIRDVREEERQYFSWVRELYQSLAKRYIRNPIRPLGLEECLRKNDQG